MPVDPTVVPVSFTETLSNWILVILSISLVFLSAYLSGLREGDNALRQRRRTGRLLRRAGLENIEYD